jgi:fatty-acid desaturase
MTPHAKKIILPVHSLALLGLILMIAGFASPKWLFLTWFSWFMISGFGIAVGFHRLFSHNAFETPQWIRDTLAYIGALGAQGSPIFWASLHVGTHHPFADTEKDVHSPIHGWWRSYMGWQFHLKPENVPFRAGARLMREPFQKFLHKNYNRIYWGTVIIVALIDWRIAAYGLLLPGVISMHQENLVDLFCHIPTGGYRNYPTKDQSVNNYFLGLFAFGQGWHNNHHARPWDYNFGGNHWYEFDMCSILVPLIRARHSQKISTARKVTSPSISSQAEASVGR